MIQSDFRVIAATNRKLEERVESGAFRQDLLFRLKGLMIHLPPLKERIGDVRELVLYYVGELCRRYSVEAKGVSQDFIDTLSRYDWPGNVRELYQTLEQVFSVAIQHPTLFSQQLPEHIRIFEAQANLNLAQDRDQKADSRRKTQGKMVVWKEYKEDVEKKYLLDLMILAGGSVLKACKIAALSRSRLYQLLDKYELRTKK